MNRTVYNERLAFYKESIKDPANHDAIAMDLAYMRATEGASITLWQPIETAPTDNARPLYLARLDTDGKLLEIDFDGSWVSESESWEIPKIYHYWGSAQGIEEPTHWAYQIGSPPVTA